MKRIIYVTIIAALCCVLPKLGHAAAPVMTDYCATPPFLVQAVPPNIMIVIDMSGSMQFPAHIPDNWDLGGGHYHTEVAQVPLLSGDYNGTLENGYYGYFKTDKFYQYSSNKFVENGDCTEAQWNTPADWSSTKIPGNLLNWATMSRIDVLRKVLIGGKSVSKQSNNHTLLSEGGTWEYIDSTLHCQFAVSGGSNQEHSITITSSGGTCRVTQSSANVKVDVPEAERIGVVQEIGDRDNDGTWDTGAARFGIMMYSTDDVGRIVDGCDNQNTSASSFLTDLQNEKPYNGTPTGEAIENALDYFKHTRSTCRHYANNAYMSDSKDPWQASCQQSFILLVSDGEWNGSVDPVVPAREGRIGTFDSSSYDLRTDFTGSQVVSTYTVYAFAGVSGGRNALQQTALYGGFTDKDANYWPYPYTAYPTDSRTVTLPNTSCDPAGTWDETCREWDESRDGIPDNYYEATEGGALRDKITEAIFDMMKRASSGTSVSVLSTSAEGEGSLFQAYFNYKIEQAMRTVYWVGYLNGLWIDQYGNIREDTVQDQALVLTDDYIISFFVDTDGATKVRRYHDIDGNGVIDTGEYVDTQLISDIMPIWEGGKKLALRDDTSTPRTIYTFIDADNDGVKDSGEFGSTAFVDTSAAATTLQPYLNASSSTVAQNIIKFIRGRYVSTMRERRLTVAGIADKVWKLGDITYSTPVAVGAPMMKFHTIYGDTTYHQYYTQYKNRRIVVYAGANDGMLHAFNAGYYHEGDDPSTTETGKIERGWYSDPADSKANNADIGKELWAYIPYNLLPHLQWLTTSNYCHVYYADLKPRVVDARIFTADATHPYGWGTILIGGMRLGGGKLSLTKNFTGSGNQTRVFRSAYFAIDITDPVNPSLLWEYWDKADTTNSNLGFTTSYPTVVRIGERDQVGTWYVLFGSGVATGKGTDAGDGSTTTRYVYVLNAKTGALVRKVDMAGVDSGISSKKVFMADPITVDLAVDYNVDIGYIGATYYNAGWLGKMYRININEATADQWTFSTFMSLPKPVTAAPSATVDTYNRLWLYFGTGRYFNDADRSDTSDQKLYGVWDPGTGTVDPTSELNDVTNIHVYENNYVYNNTTFVSAFNPYLAARRSEYSAGTRHGWYLTMTGGERSLHKPTILGGIVLFPTFKPTTDACGYGGSSYLYTLYYESGTANDEPVIGTSTTEKITIDSKDYFEIIKKTYLGSGMPTHAVIHSGKEEGVMSLIQLGTGVIKQLTVYPAFTPKSQTLFWEERR